MKTNKKKGLLADMFSHLYHEMKKVDSKHASIKRKPELDSKFRHIKPF